MLKIKKKQKVIGEYKTHQTDTGSVEVQVAILSEEIDQLAKHLKKHQGQPFPPGSFGYGFKKKAPLKLSIQRRRKKI